MMAPHARVGCPSPSASAIRLDAVGDAEQEDGQASGETSYSRPVDLLVGADSGGLAQHSVGPDGSREAHRDADQEDQPPVDDRKNPAQNQPDKLSRR